MTDIIGVIDLTVRHSSMNPLGIIDAIQASNEFERMVLVACKDMLERTEDAARVTRMRERGIVVEGPAAKFFQFETSEDAMAFSKHLRSLLLERALPFKLCLARGSLGERSLRDTWSARVAEAQTDTTEGANARRELLEQFSTADGAQVEQLFQAYRAPGFHEDAISLALDLDSFKGFGIWINPQLEGELAEAELFYNHHPLSSARKGESSAKQFIDCRFPRLADDVIIRPVEAQPDVDPAGQSARIASVCDLLRRSVKAGDENGIHYVSLLVTIVRSSHFGSMEKFTELEAAGANDDRLLALGWQRHPPIFHTLLLDPAMRPTLRRMPGLEFVMAALLDEVHASCMTLSSGKTEPASADLGSGPGVLSGVIANSATRRSKLANAAASGGRFAETVRAIEAIFGENLLRKIWNVPETSLNAERKRAALDVTVRR